MIARNEVGRGMDAAIGQFVLNSKANLSCDYQTALSDNIGMADRMSETEETLAFVGRVRAAREAKFSTQKPVYTALGIPQDQYKHYETKRPLPRKFIPKFCVLTEVTMEWLLTGEGKGGPQQIEIPKQAPRRLGRAARGRAA